MDNPLDVYLMTDPIGIALVTATTLLIMVWMVIKIDDDDED